MKGLTLCLIVKDEAAKLPSCLTSVKPIADQIVVVDTGSTDNSLEIASEYGAQVSQFDFTHCDFAAARNYALSLARGRWALMLDADETLPNECLPLVEELLSRDENAGYFLERHNQWSNTEAPTVDYVVRLFPKQDKYRYRGRVHETIDESILAGGGRLLRTNIRLEHQFSADKETRRRKNRWYIEILKEEIAADPNDYSRLDFLAAEYHQLEMFDEATAVAEQLARLRPDDARSHLFAGVYHVLYKPDFHRARADLTRALSLKPGYVEAEAFLRTLDERERALQPGI